MIYFVSGMFKEQGISIPEKLEAYVVANNKKEARRKAKSGYKGQWKGFVKIEKSNVAFCLTDKMYLVNGKYYSDGIAMYLHSICPDWVEATKTADLDESFFSTLLREVKPTDTIIKDNYTLWYKYDTVYIQELFHEVIKQNGWQLWLTAGSPLALVDGGEIVGVLMPGDNEQIERMVK